MPNDSNATVYGPLNFDVIARIRATTADSPNDKPNIFVKYVSGSEAFVTRLYSIDSENNVLQTALVNLWDNYKYNQEYISFLLGTYTKEEFKKVAEEYAKPFDTLHGKEDVLFATKLFFSILDTTLSSSDLSVLMNVDCDSIEKVMLELEDDSQAERIE